MDAGHSEGSKGWQSRSSLDGDHFLYSQDPIMWFRGDGIGRNSMYGQLICS